MNCSGGTHTQSHTNTRQTPACRPHKINEWWTERKNETQSSLGKSNAKRIATANQYNGRVYRQNDNSRCVCASGFECVVRRAKKKKKKEMRRKKKTKYKHTRPTNTTNTTNNGQRRKKRRRNRARGKKMRFRKPNRTCLAHTRVGCEVNTGQYIIRH